MNLHKQLLYIIKKIGHQHPLTIGKSRHFLFEILTSVIIKFSSIVDCQGQRLF